jgi:8-oxo-dGTP diphosphatase
MPRQFGTLIHVVIAIILNPERHVLIAQRLAHQEKGGLWEFPGGKVEPNETPFQALQRELQEEIGIQIISANPWLQIEYQYPTKSVLLDAWMVERFDGIPTGAEGQPICWGSCIELTEREFPDGNKEIIKKLVDLLKAE